MSWGWDFIVPGGRYQLKDSYLSRFAFASTSDVEVIFRLVLKQEKMWRVSFQLKIKSTTCDLNYCPADVGTLSSRWYPSTYDWTTPFTRSEIFVFKRYVVADNQGESLNYTSPQVPCRTPQLGVANLNLETSSTRSGGSQRSTHRRLL